MATRASMTDVPGSQPRWHIEDGTARLEGQWTFERLQTGRSSLERELGAAKAGRWDITGVERFDTVGLRTLVRRWNNAIPADLLCTQAQRVLLEQIIAVGDAPPLPQRHLVPETLVAIGEALLSPFQHVGDFIRLLGGYVLATLVIVLRPRFCHGGNCRLRPTGRGLRRLASRRWSAS